MAIPSSVCITIPPLSPELPTITLPMGAAFGPIVDFANGLPTDCSVHLDLMKQFSVALGQLKCPLAVLEFFQKLKEVIDGIDATKPPPVALAGLLDLLEPLGKLVECFVSITPAQVILSIRDILKAIVTILSCLIQEIESIINFRVRLDVSAAATNSKLADILICAQGNAEASAEGVLQVLQAFSLILNIVASLPGASELGIPQLPTSFSISAQTPSLADVADVSAIQDVLNVLKEVVDVVQSIIDKVP